MSYNPYRYQYHKYINFMEMFNDLVEKEGILTKFPNNYPLDDYNLDGLVEFINNTLPFYEINEQLSEFGFSEVTFVFSPKDYDLSSDVTVVYEYAWEGNGAFTSFYDETKSDD